eukprot:g2017.t1
MSTASAFEAATMAEKRLQKRLTSPMKQISFTQNNIVTAEENSQKKAEILSCAPSPHRTKKETKDTQNDATVIFLPTPSPKTIESKPSPDSLTKDHFSPPGVVVHSQVKGKGMLLHMQNPVSEEKLKSKLQSLSILNQARKKSLQDMQAKRRNSSNNPKMDQINKTPNHTPSPRFQKKSVVSSTKASSPRYRRTGGRSSPLTSPTREKKEHQTKNHKFPKQRSHILKNRRKPSIGESETRSEQRCRTGKNTAESSNSRPQLSSSKLNTKRQLRIVSSTPSSGNDTPTPLRNDMEQERKSPFPLASPLHRVANGSNQRRNSWSKSSCVSEIDRIKKRREERRSLQKQRSENRKKQVKAMGGKLSMRAALCKAAIAKFRESIVPRKGPLTNALEVTTSDRVKVFCRKRPLFDPESFDIITCFPPMLRESTTVEEEKTSHSTTSAAKLSLSASQHDLCSPASTLVVHKIDVKVDMTETMREIYYDFDGVFPETASNDEVFGETLKPCLNNFTSATKITSPSSVMCFAYGQTGSGKTFTMTHLFKKALETIFSTPASTNAEVKISCYEIYCSRVNDLLIPRKTATDGHGNTKSERTACSVREDKHGRVHVSSKLVKVETLSEALDLLAYGFRSRAVGTTAKNQQSSRSHAVFNIHVKMPNDNDEGIVHTVSLIDLAGSERGSERKGDDRQNRREASEINKSLLALKECINKKVNGKTHVPYRGSLLTRILKRGFAHMNSKIVVISCISPSDKDALHTINTLKYSQRIKSV